MSVTLPTTTLTPKTTNRASIAAFAAYFVRERLAATLPDTVLDTTLDLLLCLRQLKGCYEDHLRELAAANIDLSDLPGFFTPVNWKALNTNQRLYLEACISNEAEQINGSVLRGLDFTARQLIALTPDAAGMDELLDRRAAKYPTYAAPLPMRKARRKAPIC
jgi:hypothetical protein